MKSNSTVRPQLVSRLQNSVIISFNITEVEGGYEYDQVKVSEDFKVAPGDTVKGLNIDYTFKQR